jgi:hypothetical protein
VLVYVDETLVMSKILILVWVRGRTSYSDSSGLSWVAVSPNAGLVPYKTTQGMLIREIIVVCSNNPTT